MTPPEDPRETPAPRRFSPQWWVRDRAGRLAVVQRPNPALAVWLVTKVIGWTGTVHGAASSTLVAVGRGALLVWALDEVLRGTSPLRRVLGAVVGVLVVIAVLP